MARSATKTSIHGFCDCVTCSLTCSLIASRHLLILQDTRQALGQRRAQAQPSAANWPGKQLAAATESLDPDTRPAAYPASTVQPTSAQKTSSFQKHDGKIAKTQHQLQMPPLDMGGKRADGHPTPATTHGPQWGVHQESSTEEGPLGQCRQAKEAADRGDAMPAMNQHVAHKQAGYKASASPMYQEGLPQGRPMQAAAIARSTTPDLMSPPTPGQVG